MVPVMQAGGSQEGGREGGREERNEKEMGGREGGREGERERERERVERREGQRTTHTHHATFLCTWFSPILMASYMYCTCRR